ncbi:MAG: protein-export chaperone SecB [Spirochaetes bacterium]|nr:protein-export chaperone SecB [Spirochaetota bacterium]
MNKEKQPGISINRIILATSYFHRIPQITDDYKSSISLAVKNNIDKEKNILSTELELTLNQEDSPVFAKVVYVGVFSIMGNSENMSFKEFVEYSAPAILIPYAREEIQNRLIKADLPEFAILPPINLTALNKKKITKK